jgi:hypothetical protein
LRITSFTFIAVGETRKQCNLSHVRSSWVNGAAQKNVAISTFPSLP